MTEKEKSIRCPSCGFLIPHDCFQIRADLINSAGILREMDALEAPRDIHILVVCSLSLLLFADDCSCDFLCFRWMMTSLFVTH